jgi:hypothetical protein
MFDDSPDSWYVAAYWATYRFFYWNVGSPRDWYRSIKWHIQRARRGWAECDTWSLDWYLSGWLPKALRHLKNTKHSIPLAVFPSDSRYIKSCGNPTEEAEKVAEARWNEIMDKMIAGFEASARIQDGLYEAELGEYPLHRPIDVREDSWKKTHKDRMLAVRKLEERDQKLFEEGMALFTTYYFNLWD